MDILIITGGSKGIGKALAAKYASKNYNVFSLARSVAKTDKINEFSVDLSDLTAIQETFFLVFKELEKIEVSSITLINNAGRLGEIAPLEKLKVEDISKTILVNTTVPLILSSLFIKHTLYLNCKKQIINISSGAAIKAYEGWSVYCSSKAAMDMMTKTIAAEQNLLKNTVKVMGIYPGVVDTSMQQQIRNTPKSNFKNLQRFVNLKENNELYTPDFVAAAIYKIDTESLLKNGDIFDIRNLY
ncbi:SDR family NAD(P)-dependent oxidoreductase [Tenacibaculum maritimum]|uniref:SDR family NAD(P)-dependent oxidoreductase n=1 Tax=Tenacibaculum maritimum TaxID=107401 RepID=UPI0038760AD0